MRSSSLGYYYRLIQWYSYHQGYLTRRYACFIARVVRSRGLENILVNFISVIYSVLGTNKACLIKKTYCFVFAIKIKGSYGIQIKRLVRRTMRIGSEFRNTALDGWKF